MEDIIDIIVTETTNTIEITSQASDELIDVNIIDNREDITLNVTPTLVEININSLTGNFGVEWGDITGTLADQTDLNTALGLKADLVDGKVPSSQLPSYVDDIIEVATYSALPATGETGKIYVVLDTNLIYRWSGSAYIEIKDSSAVWGAITGTLSSQTDLQNALNAKVPYTGATGNVNLGEYGATVGYLGFDTTPSGTPTGIGTMYWDSANRTVSLIDGDGDTTLQLGQEERVLVHNNTGSTLTDGQVVYVTGSTGELPSVALAVNTSDSTSSVTFGIVTESIAHGADGFITTSGIVHGLNTNAFTEGSALWLGSTAGTFTETKPVAPAHAVLVGYVIKKSGGNGSIFVKIQNGYELDELHDVLITSKANNDGLFYESSSGLWKNKSIATVLGYTPANGATYLPLSGGTLTGSLYGTAVSLSSSVTASALYVTGMTAGSGAIYHTGSRLTFANYNTNGTLHFEVNGGVGALTVNADRTVSFTNTISAAGATLSGALSGTSSEFSGLNNFRQTDAGVFVKLGGNLTKANIYQFTSGGLAGAVFNIGHNFYYDGTSYGQDNTSKSGWVISSNLNSDTFTIARAAAGSTSAPTSVLGFASTGAATFSSSVTATQLNMTSSNTSPDGITITSGDEVFIKMLTSTSGVKNWAFVTTFLGGSDFGIYQSNSNGGDPISSGTARLYINGSGYVGIGTTSPDVKLQVRNDVNGNSLVAKFSNLDTNAGTGAYIGFNTGYDATARIGALREGSGNNSSLVFLPMKNETPTEAMRITSGGDLLVGMTSATGAGLTSVRAGLFSGQRTASADTVFQAWNQGTSGDNKFVEFYTEGGGGSLRGSIDYNRAAGLVRYNVTSDYRLKTDLKQFNGSEILNKVKVYDYQLKETGARVYGVMAHELQEVLPYAVTGIKDGEQMQSVDYSKIVPVMVQAIKELKAKIEILENK